VEAWLPLIYLKGISTGNFSKALAALFGKDPWGCRHRRLPDLRIGAREPDPNIGERSTLGRLRKHTSPDFFGLLFDGDMMVPC